MANDFRGSASSSSTNGGDVTVNLSSISGLAEGDLVIVAGSIGDNDGIDFTMDTSSSGWTKVADLHADDTQDVDLGVWWKIMGPTPDSSFVLTGQGGTDAACAAVAMAFIGSDQTTPMDVTPTTATGTDTANANPPSITWSTSGAWVVAIGTGGHTGGNAISFTLPTGYTTNAISVSGNDTSDTTVAMGYNSNPSASEDPGAFTYSGTDSTSFCWAAVTLAIRPAAGGSTISRSLSDSVETSDSLSCQRLLSRMGAEGPVDVSDSLGRQRILLRAVAEALVEVYDNLAVGGASWLEALDTDTNRNISGGNVQLRLRVGIVNSGSGAGASAFKLKYSKNSGAYADVTASSSNIRTFGCAWFVDGDDVGQIITAGNYQGDNNAAEEASGAFTLTSGLAAGYRFEAEISLELVAADLSNGDTIDLRVYKGDDTALDTYTITPRITISSGGTVITRSLSDNLSVLDSMGPTREKTRLLSDIATLSDVLLRFAYVSRFGSDSITVVDALSNQITRLRALGESVEVIDSLSKIARLTRALSTAIDTQDAAVRTAMLMRELPEAVITADTLGRLRVIVRTLSDAGAVTDSLARGFSLTRQFSEAISVFDSADRVLHLRRVLADDAAVFDALISSIQGAGATVISRLLSDAVSTSDSLELVRRFTRALIDVTTATDATIRMLEMTRALSESAEAGDSLSAQRKLFRELGDLSDVYDSLRREAILRRMLAEVVNLDDSLLASIPTIINAAIAIVMRAIESQTIEMKAGKEHINMVSEIGANIAMRIQK